jgi:catalase
VFTTLPQQGFIALFATRQPDPATQQPGPAKVNVFNDDTPEILLQARHFALQPAPASFASSHDWDLHRFGFSNANGDRQSGQWKFKPV